ncbi:hypothetical protein [Streptomyces sp. NPDC005732]|uniref:hypothetical protein n=1 Tax=Streptomyces sp. NPDC005732 TaxID=3157057 RepID=UPI0033D86569
MAQSTTRIYKVINAPAVLGPGAVYRFRGPDRPAGTIGNVSVRGRRHRVRVAGYLVVDELHGRVAAAEFIDVYL